MKAYWLRPIKRIPFDLLYGWILAAIIVLGLLLTMECTAKPAHAETGLYIDLAGGVSNFFVTATDGDYRQDGVGPRSFKLTDVAYRALLGYRINDRWSVQGGYINFGKLKQDARFVDDAHYDPHASQCLANCAGTGPYKMTDYYRGWEASVTRTFPFESVAPFLRLGAARIKHAFSITRLDVASFHQNEGVFYSVLMGAGLCSQTTLQVCAEATYYHGVGGSNGFMGNQEGWPLSKEMLVSLVSLKVNL